MDLDPDPAIFVVDLQSRRQQKTNFNKKFSAFYFWRNIFLIFQRKKRQKEVTKQQESRFFLLFLLDDRRIRIWEAQKHVDPVDPEHWSKVGFKFGSGTFISDLNPIWLKQCKKHPLFNSFFKTTFGKLIMKSFKYFFLDKVYFLFKIYILQFYFHYTCTRVNTRQQCSTSYSSNLSGPCQNPADLQTWCRCRQSHWQWAACTASAPRRQISDWSLAAAWSSEQKQIVKIKVLVPPILPKLFYNLFLLNFNSFLQIKCHLR